MQSICWTFKPLSYPVCCLVSVCVSIFLFNLIFLYMVLHKFFYKKAQSQNKICFVLLTFMQLKICIHDTVQKLKAK